MRLPAMRKRGTVSMASCRNAGMATNGENDGDDEYAEAGVRGGDADAELQEQGGRNAEDGEDDKPRKHLQHDVVEDHGEDGGSG